MSSWLNILLIDLMPELVMQVAERKLDLLYEVSLVDAEGEFLASFRMDLNGKYRAIDEGRPKLSSPAFPITITAKDDSGGQFTMIWTPPTIQ